MDARRHARYRMMIGRSKESEGDLKGAKEITSRRLL